MLDAYVTRGGPLPAQAVHGAVNERQGHDLAEKSALNLAGWQRARADYENLRKEMEVRIAHAAEQATDSFLRDLLPIVDYFDAALRQLPNELKSHTWTEGIRRIDQALQAFLKATGVTTTGEEGETFDASRHESLAEEPSEHPRGTITHVAARGYVRNERVLRPARVRISNKDS